MTKNEAQKMQRLETENAMLRAQIGNHMRVYGDCLVEIIELKAKIELVESAIRGAE